MCLVDSNIRHLKSFWIYPVILLGFMVMFYFVDKDWSSFISNYQEVTSSCRIGGEIENVKIKRGIGYIKLKTGEGYFLYVADNLSYTPSSFSLFVRKGDSLSKQKSCDTILVKRKSKDYVFVLDEILNK